MVGEQRIVRCAGASVCAHAVIVAAGSTPRGLGVPGEGKFLGRGVSHCASCDAPFFKGKGVCVIGGGDSALDEALVLSAHAARVMVFHRGASLDAQQALRDQVARGDNIKIVLATIVEEILGEQAVTAVRLREVGLGAIRIQEVSGVFIYVGLEPNTAFLRGVLALDPMGHIETDIMMRASVPGIFAAGDIRKNSVAQLAAAAGDGATAAIAAFRYLKGSA